MLTYRESKPTTSGKHLIEGSCRSSDVKPVDVANGSILMEIDTSTLYMFDEESQSWEVWK